MQFNQSSYKDLSNRDIYFCGPIIFDQFFFQVIDSWEEISAADAPQLPKSAIKIESPPKKVDTPKKSEAPTKTEAPKKPDTHQSKKSEGGKKSGKNSSDKKSDKNIVEQMAGLSITQDKPRY